MAGKNNVKKSTLTGLEPLTYKGVNPSASLSLITVKRAPTEDDIKKFNIGDLWIYRDDTLIPTFKELWILAAISKNVATWIRILTTSDVALDFITDSGTASPANNILELFGNGSIFNTSGTGNTVTYAMTNGTDGQLLIGASGGAVAWGNITSTGTVDISVDDNKINLEAVGAGAYITTIDGDTGTAIPSSQNINVLGGANITTSAGGSTLTVDLDNDVTIPGTLTISLLGAGVVQTNAGGLISSSNGTDGQVLIGGGAAPAWANITSTSITITNGVNSIDLSVPGAGDVQREPFLAIQAATASGVLGSGTGRSLGQDIAQTEVFDVGNNVYIGDGAGTAASFTAPETGKYYLNVYVDYASAVTVNYFADLVLKIVTSNRTYVTDIKQKTQPGLDNIQQISVFADMDATDTATYFVAASESSGAAINIEGSAVPTTWISGYLTR